MNRTFRVFTVATAALLAAATLGCGVVSKAKQAVGNVSAITDLADKLGKSDQLTYTAVYKLDDGTTATVAHQPPDSAFTGRDGTFIVTAAALLICKKEAGHTVCRRSPHDSRLGQSADQAAYVTQVAGSGFISAPMAVGLMTAAAVVPGANIDKSDRKVAGLSSTCLHVTGLPADKDPTAVSAKEFTVCVADNGLLTTFSGLGTDEKKLGVELTTFSGKVAASAFKPPAGAKIVDIGDQGSPR
jgi:hypothetical protein